MSKIAFLFPGQGAQYIGMGQDFYETYPKSKEVFEIATKVSGMDLSNLCFTENENLNITRYTQIAMLTTEVAMLEVLKEHGITSDVNAGLSLGEYGALVASEVLSFEDAVALVVKRGAYMQDAVPSGGAMSAVLGMEAEVIEEVLTEIDGIVSIANYNCPGQIVITGEEEAVAAASVALKEKGCRRILPLKVSGPFHSKMLEGAEAKLEEALEEIEIKDFEVPYVSNVTAEYIRDTKDVKKLLARQVSSPVKWQQSVEKMIAEGVDLFIEIGPGKTLTSFMQKINKEVKVLRVEKVQDLETVVKEWKEV